MKRALVVSILAALGLATIVACNDGAEETLTNGDGANNKLADKSSKDDEETETPPSQKKSDTANPVTPPAQNPARRSADTCADQSDGLQRSSRSSELREVLRHQQQSRECLCMRRRREVRGQVHRLTLRGQDSEPPMRPLSWTIRL
jgi:hypothetical protein